jgi:superfamily II DNA/RNA helicase
MGLHPSFASSLHQSGFTQPTPIQGKTIPLALANNDILGTAQTGTGKTLAFMIPVINKLIENPMGSALILVPTRELAQQVTATIKKILPSKSPIKMALLIGGEAIGRQFLQLKAKPRIIVGTPGRVIDHLKRRSFNPHPIQFLVLDEADRMFDMGFGVQLEEIISSLSIKRQTLMFSATMAPSIVKLAGKYLNKPQHIAIGSVTTPSAKIKQEVIKTPDSEKFGKLLGQLDERDGSIIVFVKTKRGAERLADKLNKMKYRASAMHGDLKQNKRQKVINDFRLGQQKIMVATDIAARGLDIPHIQHVINYDLPQAPEDYIHRIGRTARAGMEGFALCLIAPGDAKKWKAICRLMQQP